MATRRTPAAYDDYFGVGDTFDPTAPFDVGGYQPSAGIAPLPPGVDPKDPSTLPGGTPQPPPPPAPPASRLYGSYDPGKLSAASGGDTKSAKYEFLNAAQQSGGYDPSAVLKSLQASNPTRWNGWTAQGDKISYSGNNLDPVFNGLTSFDVVQDYDNPNGPGGWAWQDLSGGGGGRPRSDGSNPGGAQFSGGGMDFSKIKAALEGLFPGGAFNQDIVNRRTESAREDLERFNKSRMASNRAILAERGLLGSGPEATEAFSREGDIADRYIGAARDIYADESENADARMMQALSLATGMSMDDAQNAIDLFRAQTERSGMENQFTLGQGGLALDNARLGNDYNLNLARFGLDRDRALWDMENGSIDQFIGMLQLLMNGAQTSAGGHF